MHRGCVFERSLASKLMAFATALIVACSSELATPSPESVTQVEEVETISGPGALTLVLVVDDGAGEATVRLRETVLQSARDFAESQLSPGGCASHSPLGTPIDLDAIVVHPSALAGQELTTPLELPMLTWRADWRRIEDAEAWLAGIEQALAFTAPPNTNYALAQATRRAWDLALGRVSPSNNSESYLVSSVERTFVFTVATMRDDSSPGAIGQYEIERHAFAADSRLAILQSVVAPDVANAGCGEEIARPPRLQEWVPFSVPSFFSNSSCTYYPLDPSLSSDCFAQCRQRMPLVDATGTAQCRVTVLTEGTSACDAKFGRIDPLSPDGVRRPRMAETLNGDLARACEVQQLEGEALRSCISEPECTACTPGWCSAGPSVLIPGLCHEGFAVWPIRFTRGADRPGEYHTVCKTEAAISEPVSSASP